MNNKIELYSEKIRAVLEWASTDAPESFDSTFVEKLNDNLENSGRLSVKQMNAVDNIIEQFNIDIEEY